MLTTKIDSAVNEIVDAFADVLLGNGVSLREADVIDVYGTDRERSAAREQDEHIDWQRIPDEDIESHSSVLCFMDAEGLRFHLPAYMRYTLRRFRESESMSTDFTIYRLSDPSCIERLLVYLTDHQVNAIKSFLNACLEIGSDRLDVSNVPLALRQWQGDKEAARELQEAQAATLKQVAEWRGLDADLYEKFFSGNLTKKEQQQLRGQILAAAKCGPSGRQPKTGLWSRALVMVIYATPFIAFATYMYFRLRANGMWWTVGVGAIAIAFVAFLIELRRHQNILQ